VTAPVGLVHVVCPDCDAPIPIPVTAETAGRSDEGVLQVSVIAEKTEVWAHSLTCDGRLP
jgi:hypothetical protein